ncbi:pectin lyase-like protein [Pseudovirgaria hyperparasitica]|uniref:Pectin lyase-like protein n=1 Tax=Pseudovirgaria hyperparasitica TaxID=470096 RepID=A0A6A6W5T2_9PEZI|nr:pectin lyase-like protein [Pseudovirgaria hyperparasitica]KAF2758242.1 pectin lyase-like protein [Pseudovirgaria hyperparasitica]
MLGTTAVVSIALASLPALTAAAVCVVPTGLDDSAPAIIDAFRKCGHNSNQSRGKVVFQNTTYTVGSVMNITGLSNVDVDLQGTLAWDNSNLSYWLSNSLPVGYQNQSSAWLFGGSGIHWTGHGYGTFNGNGQAWYDFVKGASNYPRRPHQITFTGVKDAVFEGLRFINSQMWTMTVIHSENVLLQDIYVNTTSINKSGTSNTDGADTIYANNITFNRWVVYNGDDCISLKANSTNILISNSICYRGQGIAFGSIGQYKNTFETIQNVVIRNLTASGTKFGTYFKTWTGIAQGYPPNGGGGGIGYMQNITLEDFKLVNTANTLLVTQCTNYQGATGECDTSKFNIHDIALKNWSGTTRSGAAVSLDCSKASPCYGFDVKNFGVIVSSNSSAPTSYCCDAVENGTTTGFTCNAPIWATNNGA